MPVGGQVFHEPDTVTICVPIAFCRRGGRKTIIAPEGSSSAFAQSRFLTDSALVKMLARAFRWRKLLEAGAYSTIQDLAVAEQINPSYVSRILRLTLLSPAIVETILHTRHPTEITLDLLMKPFPSEWTRQPQA